MLKRSPYSSIFRSDVMPSPTTQHCLFCGYINHVITIHDTSVNNPNCHQCGLSISETWRKAQDDLAALFSKQNIAEHRVADLVGHPENHKFSTLSQFPSSAAHTIPQYIHQPDSGALLSDVSQDTRCDANCHRSQSTRMWDESPQTLLQLSVDNQQESLYSFQEDARFKVNSTSRDEYLHDLDHSQAFINREVDMLATGDYEDVECDTKEAEPYMATGYAVSSRHDGRSSESFEQRRDSATLCTDSELSDESSAGLPYKLFSDPIYQSRRWWEHGDSEPMEHQYGAFEGMIPH